MRLKTTVKLFFQNLSLVWKVTLYKVITYSIILGLLSLFAMPLINKLNESGFFQLVTDVFDFSKFSFADFGVNLSNIAQEFKNIIVSNWATLSYSIIMFFIVATFLNYYMNALIDIPLCEVLYGSMSCNAKFSFSGCFVKNLFLSLKFALLKMFTTFILDTLIVLILTTFIIFLAKYIMPIFIVILFIILTVLLFSFRLTFFSCFAPTIVAKGYGVVKGLIKSIKFSFKNFWANFATAIALLIVFFIMNAFAAIFTFLAGLILTIPTTFVLVSVYNMVIFYSSSGMYFYIGENNIQDASKGVKRPELQDSMKKIKNII